MFLNLQKVLFKYNTSLNTNLFLYYLPIYLYNVGYIIFVLPFSSHYAANLSLSAILHFPILCTIQYSIHCILIFFCPLNVNHIIPLQYVISANTGSIICNRREYNFLYFGVSIFSLIFCERFSSYLVFGIYNVRFFFSFFPE